MTFSTSGALSVTTSTGLSMSGSISVAFNYPQIVGVQNTDPTDLFNLNIQWQRPNNFSYQNYEVILFKEFGKPPLTFPNILTESFVLNAANTNNTVQPGSSFIVQVRGFLNGVFGPLSFPLNVSTSGGDVYGPTGTDATSVNNLVCTYYPKELRCTWNTGSRNWINATFYVDCVRSATPYQNARAYIVLKVLNTGGPSAPLPTVEIVPLPSGCRCNATLTVFYASPVIRVDLRLPTNTGDFINTDKAVSGFPNTPTTLIV